MEAEQIKQLSFMPEYSSIDSFIDDNETGYFSSDDLAILNYRLRRPIREIKMELEKYGLRLRQRNREQDVRGFSSNSHDRWDGKGSCPSHGGGGGSSIIGFFQKEK